MLDSYTFAMLTQIKFRNTLGLTMTKSKIAPLSLNVEGVLLPQNGLTSEELAASHADLEKARCEVMGEDLRLIENEEAIPPEKQPLDAGFVEMPRRLLEAYRANRTASELGQILATATRLRESVDRVVVLGIGGSYMGARALFDTCCHPYHNELSRADRGGRPRIYFEGNNVDNDATSGLLDLLQSESDPSRPEGCWAVIVISKSGKTLETAAALRLFVRALGETAGEEAIGERVVPITGSSGRLHDLSRALGCRDCFRVPDQVGGRFSILSPVGLLPAAVMGIDVVRLLEGAVAMNEHFQQADPGANIVLDYVNVCHQLEKKRGITIRVLSAWAKSLESVGLWYDQLLAESLGKKEQGATPLTVVNTRDLHSRAQQHQEGRRDKLMTNLVVNAWRRDPLSIGSQENDQDKLNKLADKTLPMVMAAALAGTNQAYRDDHRPTIDLHLPAVDEASLGQLFQMLMLATAVEGRLIGINPYGQPGVEGYKMHMEKFLQR